MRLIEAEEKEQLEKIERLYNAAFPKVERKPFSLIMEKAQLKQSEVLYIEDDGCFCGLAVTLFYRDMVLLDYFAINEEARGKGMGTKALSLLQQRYAERRFFLEAETPQVECSNKRQREKRLAFYERGGMKRSGMVVELMTVPMEVLTYNCDISYDEYSEMYNSLFDGNISRNLKLLWRKGC